MVLRPADEPSGPLAAPANMSDKLSGGTEDAVRSEPLRSPFRIGKEKVRVHRASVKPCDVHAPERSQSRSQSTSLDTVRFHYSQIMWIYSEFSPLFVFQVPRRRRGPGGPACISQRSRSGAENRGASSQHGKLKSASWRR